VDKILRLNYTYYWCYWIITNCHMDKTLSIWSFHCFEKYGKLIWEIETLGTKTTHFSMHTIR